MWAPATFRALLGSARFWNSLFVTFEYALVVTAISIAGGLVLAVLLNQRWLVARSFWRSLYFLPTITPTVAAAMVWMLLFNPGIGYVNVVLRAVGITGPNWLGDQTWALPTIMLLGIWRRIGFNLVIYLAALQALALEQYEAAEVDGANAWQRFRYLTVPLVKPTTAMLVILGIVDSFLVFDQIMVLTRWRAGRRDRGDRLLHVFECVFVFQDGLWLCHCRRHARGDRGLDAAAVAVYRLWRRRGRAGVTMEGRRRRYLSSNVKLLLVLVPVAFVILVPYLWMVTTSLKPRGLIGEPPYLYPAYFEFGNYVKAWQAAPFLRYYFNTLVVAVAVVAARVVLASMAAYAFACLRFPGRDLLFLLFIGTMMVPFQATIIPAFLIVRDLHWLNTYQAMIVPRMVDAFSIFLLRQSFIGVPRDYFDAARLDGARHWGILWRIVVPLNRATVVTMGLFAFLFVWNDFLVAIAGRQRRKAAGDPGRPAGIFGPVSDGMDLHDGRHGHGHDPAGSAVLPGAEAVHCRLDQFRYQRLI